MLGAIMGDMVGSIYEYKSCKTKDFNMFNKMVRMTDDSCLTIAVAKALLKHYPIKYDSESVKALQDDVIKEFLMACRGHLYAGFGGMFLTWYMTWEETGKVAPPYNSYGNGSAMRISPVGWIAKSVDEVKTLSRIVSEVTHNHPEGLKGAEAIALCIYYALHGFSKEEIKDVMVRDYYPEINDFDFNDLVENYTFNSSCMKSVPQAIYCFLISNSLEDAIRNCIAIGGDCDTIGAMAGSIAEAYYESKETSEFTKKFIYLLIDPSVEELVKKFHMTIGSGKEL